MHPWNGRPRLNSRVNQTSLSAVDGLPLLQQLPTLGARLLAEMGTAN